MTKNEQKNLEALKIGFEMTEWEDFLLVLNEIRKRDKEIIRLYRKSFIELKELKKSLYFTENELQQLQSKIHKITGDGEVMGLFNELLGIQAG